MIKKKILDVRLLDVRLLSSLIISISSSFSFFIRFAVCFAFLISISVSAQEKKHKINYEREGYVKAVVVHYEVESCDYFIELIDKAKTRIAPHKLPDEFKKDKEKVWIKYSIAKKQLPSTCMAGKQAEVIDIQKRK